MFLFVKVSHIQSIDGMQAADVSTAEDTNSASLGGPIGECHLLQFGCLLSKLGNMKLKSVAYKGTGTPVLQVEGKILTSTTGTERGDKAVNFSVSDSNSKTCFFREDKS